jgi:carbamoyltransferase
MSYLGISAGFHDAAVSIVDDSGNIVYAGHSERYTGVKNDPELCPKILHHTMNHEINHIAFYERPWMHNYQQWRSGQKCYGPWTATGALEKHMGLSYETLKNRNKPTISSYPHHLSHAAAGFQTSPFDWACVVVIDAIGEMDTVSIYRAWYDRQGRAQYQRLWRQGYPHSIGLFYSAITSKVGLRPMEDEYVTMGMAAYGDLYWKPELKRRIIQDQDNITFKHNCHIGLPDNIFDNANKESLAASAQSLTEEMVMSIMSQAKVLTKCDNLVYMGGVALNCVANSNLGELFDNIWIMPNPGDAGSSLGAAALAYGKQLNWKTPYLGTEIPGPYPVNKVLDELLSNQIVGVASGKAEFGPRALGNRSLLADPRGDDIKDRVNEIKRRQRFRPFAPAILAEYVDDYFVMPPNQPTSPYMQVVAQCRQPDEFPAIIHYDGTSRVQTVHKDCGSGLRELLEKWYFLTGCPMLLNTSLNIRGEPMVNTRLDADRFTQEYGIKVIS